MGPKNLSVLFKGLPPTPVTHDSRAVYTVCGVDCQATNKIGSARKSDEVRILSSPSCNTMNWVLVAVSPLRFQQQVVRRPGNTFT